jgi:hypothetical protein
MWHPMGLAAAAAGRRHAASTEPLRLPASCPAAARRQLRPSPALRTPYLGKRWGRQGAGECVGDL